MLRQDQFADAFKVSVTELEQYATLGLLFPKRVDNHVVYDDRSFLRMTIITKGKKLGFLIGEIKRLIDACT